MATHHHDLTALSITRCAWLARCAKETASRKLREAGLEPVKVDGRTVYYDPRDALVVLLGIGDGLSPQAERARLDRARAELAEHQLGERRGEYVAGEEVDAFLFRVLGGMAQRLNSIPAKAAAEARTAGSDAEAEAVLERFVHEALTEIADACRAAGESVERRRRGEVRRSIVSRKAAK